MQLLNYLQFRARENGLYTVDSRMILGVRYNETTFELDIVFRTGERYRYKSVPKFVYEGLMNAESHGQFMHNKVLGRYKYERLG